MPGFIWFKDWAAASHNFTLCWLILRTLVRLLAGTSKLSRETNYFRRDQYCSFRPLPLHFHSLLCILPKLSLKPVLAPSYPPGELGSHHHTTSQPHSHFFLSAEPTADFLLHLFIFYLHWTEVRSQVYLSGQLCPTLKNVMFSTMA